MEEQRAQPQQFPRAGCFPAANPPLVTSTEHSNGCLCVLAGLNRSLEPPAAEITTPPAEGQFPPSCTEMLLLQCYLGNNYVLFLHPLGTAAPLTLGKCCPGVEEAHGTPKQHPPLTSPVPEQAAASPHSRSPASPSPCRSAPARQSPPKPALRPQKNTPTLVPCPSAVNLAPFLGACPALPLSSKNP